MDILNFVFAQISITVQIASFLIDLLIITVTLVISITFIYVYDFKQGWDLEFWDWYK